MCAKCEERCAVAAEAAFTLVTMRGVTDTVVWQRVARAVREAGRLSECTSAVEAASVALAEPIAHSQGKRIGAPEWARAQAQRVLRAAEDAVLGKEKLRTNVKEETNE